LSSSSSVIFNDSLRPGLFKGTSIGVNVSGGACGDDDDDDDDDDDEEEEEEEKAGTIS
jgi:hypothetical protein